MPDPMTYISAKLKDETPVLIRQVCSEDKENLEIGMAHLSPESRYFRFFSTKKKLSEKELKMLTEVDHKNHDAWGAFDISGDQPMPIGIARYIRQPHDRTTADFAVTVIDSHEGRGLGSLLLGIIASRATDNGIEKFHSIDLADNYEFFDLLAGLEVHRQHIDHGEMDVVLSLHKNADEYPASVAGEIFRAADELYHQACG